MPKLTYYEQGSWNCTCAECGFGFKFSSMTKRWDGAWVCTTGSCNESRQPQDFLRGVKDNPSVPVARPRAELAAPTFWSTTTTNPLPWTNASGFLMTWAGS